ncbi:hypothetical protein THAOC_28942, partial [Thalassiosira oceanica]
PDYAERLKANVRKSVAEEPLPPAARLGELRQGKRLKAEVPWPRRQSGSEAITDTGPLVWGIRSDPSRPAALLHNVRPGRSTVTRPYRFHAAADELCFSYAFSSSVGAGVLSVSVFVSISVLPPGTWRVNKGRGALPGKAGLVDVVSWVDDSQAIPVDVERGGISTSIQGMADLALYDRNVRGGRGAWLEAGLWPRKWASGVNLSFGFGNVILSPWKQGPGRG